ncbi:MAG: hypothetical protein JNL16_03165 [Dechloromonas sp.]|nr:hypothetical protein [Dechloromonas sp.]
MSNSGNPNRNDYSPFIAWLVLSFLLMVALEVSDSLASNLAPLVGNVLKLVAPWNQSWPFDTPIAKAHTAIFVLLIPVQIITLFNIPRNRFLVEPQQKGPGRLLGMMAVFSLVPCFAYLWGLSIAGKWKLLGNSFGVAFVVFLVTICISAVVRAIPIYIEMLSERKHSEVL